MEDSLGLYYNPRPAIPSVRVYVRRSATGEVEFRMWDREHQEVWEKHGWLPYSVVAKAAEMFRSMNGHEGQDPLVIYDKAVAEALLKEGEARELRSKKSR